MVIKVYISGMSGSKEVKKRQQRVTMILDSKHISYTVIDITEPGQEEEKDFMQKNSLHNGATISDQNPRHPLPPQLFNDTEYCGDYDDFDLANEVDNLEVFLKIEAPKAPAEAGSEVSENQQKNGDAEQDQQSQVTATEAVEDDDENKENKTEEGANESHTPTTSTNTEEQQSVDGQQEHGTKQIEETNESTKQKDENEDLLLPELSEEANVTSVSQENSVDQSDGTSLDARDQMQNQKSREAPKEEAKEVKHDKSELEDVDGNFERSEENDNQTEEESPGVKRVADLQTVDTKTFEEHQHNDESTDDTGEQDEVVNELLGDNLNSQKPMKKSDIDTPDTNQDSEVRQEKELTEGRVIDYDELSNIMDERRTETYANETRDYESEDPMNSPIELLEVESAKDPPENVELENEPEDDENDEQSDSDEPVSVREVTYKAEAVESQEAACSSPSGQATIDFKDDVSEKLADSDDTMMQEQEE